MSPELLRYKFVEVLEAESLLIGRVTYESFAEAWPKRSGAFADKMNAMPKHVVSTTLKQPSWNSAVIAADVVPTITKLREADGGPILVEGSRTLIHTLMAHNLVSDTGSSCSRLSSAAVAACSPKPRTEPGCA